MSAAEGIGRVPYLKPIIIVALNTGMRRGEILRMKWADLDFSRGIVTVPEAKNGEMRHIPMNAHLRKTLSEWRTHQTGEDVFPVGEFKRSWMRARKISDITRCRFHDLRHTFASRLVMAGVDLITVKELMGHKEIKMTMRYAHLSAEHKKDAVARLEKFAPEVGTNMVRPRGFEPPTLGFEVRCSIQLSYGRV